MFYGHVPYHLRLDLLQIKTWRPKVRLPVVFCSVITCLLVQAAQENEDTAEDLDWVDQILQSQVDDEDANSSDYRDVASRDHDRDEYDPESEEDTRRSVDADIQHGSQVPRTRQPVKLGRQNVLAERASMGKRKSSTDLNGVCVHLFLPLCPIGIHCPSIVYLRRRHVPHIPLITLLPASCIRDFDAIPPHNLPERSLAVLYQGTGSSMQIMRLTTRVEFHTSLGALQMVQIQERLAVRLHRMSRWRLRRVYQA